jgi:hypothetical protein
MGSYPSITPSLQEAAAEASVSLVTGGQVKPSYVD